MKKTRGFGPHSGAINEVVLPRVCLYVWRREDEACGHQMDSLHRTKSAFLPIMQRHSYLIMKRCGRSFMIQRVRIGHIYTCIYIYKCETGQFAPGGARRLTSSEKDFDDNITQSVCTARTWMKSFRELNKRPVGDIDREHEKVYGVDKMCWQPFWWFPAKTLIFWFFFFIVALCLHLSCKEFTFLVK